MPAVRPFPLAVGLALAGAVLAGCAGPRVLTTLTPESGVATAGKTVAVLTPPDAAGASVGLAQGRIAGRAPPPGQAPDFYLQVGDSARTGSVGAMGAAPSPQPAWIEAPRRKPWLGAKKTVRTVELAVLDARTGAPVAKASASDRKAGDRQPLSILVDAALARLGLIPPAS